MKIVALSDTHISSSGKKKLPDRLVQELASADLIIHAGDWISMDIYYALSGFAPVKGVYGNADDSDITDKFPFKDLIDMKGYKIGVTHGHGEKKTTEKRVREVFADEVPDLIVFGHSHIPMLRYFNKTLLVNPGSPTYKRKLPNYSFAIIDTNDELHVEMVFFNNDGD